MMDVTAELINWELDVSNICKNKENYFGPQSPDLRTNSLEMPTTSGWVLVSLKIFILTAASKQRRGFDQVENKGTALYSIPNNKAPGIEDKPTKLMKVTGGALQESTLTSHKHYLPKSKPAYRTYNCNYTKTI